jgi:D-glycerate 3-kinase
LRVLEALLQARSVALPRFDKATDNSIPISEWPLVTGPVDLVLFEGWCLGARAQSRIDLMAPINSLEQEEDPDGRWRAYVNAQLGGPYVDLFAKLDLFVFLKVPDFDVVGDWRLEQEDKLRARRLKEGSSTDGLMDEAGVRRFVAHYERVTRALLKEAPDRADVLVRLAADRSVSEVRFRSG